MNSLPADGILNLNKPLHITSHDAVAQVRRRYQALTQSRKVGHAGTLDPLADGVLVICLGAATRLSEYMMRGRKVYRAQVTLGATTSTYDAAGEVLSQSDLGQVRREEVEELLRQFVGEIQQIPPMYSAVKVKGKKLYELARAGKTVERKPREATVHSIDLLSWERPLLELEVHCGPGAYIRALAHDLGQALGVGAYLSSLRRVASGNFHISESVPLERVLNDDGWISRIVAPYEALQDYLRLTLSAEEIDQVRHGRFIRRRNDADSGPTFAFDANKRLIAILQARGELWKPHKVFL